LAFDHEHRIDRSRERRRILVVSSGLSPAVITESLYALSVAQKPAWVPDELHVITTGRGAELVETRIFGADGALRRLCAEYDLPLPEHGGPRLHVLRDDCGNIDFDAVEDSAIARMGDLALRVLKQLSLMPEADIHLSLSGGRKTMSYFAGLALSLVGRPTDRLSHVVLSDSDLEYATDFFYPPRQPREFICRPPGRGEVTRSSEGVAIALADVPFVPLRDALSETLLRGSSDWSLHMLAQRAREAISPTRLVARFMLDRARVVLNDVEIPLSPHEAALYYVLACRKSFNPRCDNDELYFYFEHAPHMLPEEDGMRRSMQLSDAFVRLARTLGNVDAKPGKLLRRSDFRDPSSMSEPTAKRLMDARYDKFAHEFSAISSKIDATLGPLLGRHFKPAGQKGKPRLWPDEVTITIEPT